MSTRKMFHGLLVVLLITLVVILLCEPIEGDGWGHYFSARQPMTWDRFVAIAKAHYEYGNPRWGQVVLIAMYHAPVVAAIGSAFVIVAVLLLSMTLVRARWPRSSDPADGWLLVQVLATAIATTPQFGAIWFYRPNFANYVLPLALQLAWLVPYRFIATRPLATSWSLALAMVPIGLLAGAGNEHTGVALALAAIACSVIAWRRDRTVPVWAVAGVVALVAGYAALLTAPGQLARYGGLATEQSALERIADRGVLGNASIIGLFLAWLSPMLIIVAVVGGRHVLARVSGRAIVGFFALAAVMVATALAAPRVPARLLVAPATMVALALGVFLVELATHHGKARRLRAVSLVVSSLALALTLAIFVVTGCESRARISTLETAPPGATVCIEPYTFARPTPFSWGDDFRSPHLTERVAKMFGLAGIERDCTTH